MAAPLYRVTADLYLLFLANHIHSLELNSVQVSLLFMSTLKGDLAFIHLVHSFTVLYFVYFSKRFFWAFFTLYLPR